MLRNRKFIPKEIAKTQAKYRNLIILERATNIYIKNYVKNYNNITFFLKR